MHMDPEHTHIYVNVTNIFNCLLAKFDVCGTSALSPNSTFGTDKGAMQN